MILIVVHTRTQTHLLQQLFSFSSRPKAVLAPPMRPPNTSCCRHDEYHIGSRRQALPVSPSPPPLLQKQWLVPIFPGVCLFCSLGSFHMYGFPWPVASATKDNLSLPAFIALSPRLSQNIFIQNQSPCWHGHAAAKRIKRCWGAFVLRRPQFSPALPYDSSGELGLDSNNFIENCPLEYIPRFYFRKIWNKM
jgi:hypothetical protein